MTVKCGASRRLFAKTTDGFRSLLQVLAIHVYFAYLIEFSWPILKGMVVGSCVHGQCFLGPSAQIRSQSYSDVNGVAEYEKLIP